ncbi:hypothetical protein [Spirosoma pollinicola]|uniref:hypothetical protein n=1 Tax=Spirosoma pollinicola TaxID=2057025 RepID=UPI001F0C5686|nr:hypothetical protein [Spirosoma pollinicola]
MRLISRGEALTAELVPFDLIQYGHGQILHRVETAAISIENRTFGAQPILAGAARVDARMHLQGGTEKGPVQVRMVSQLVQVVAGSGRSRLVHSRKLRTIHDLVTVDEKTTAPPITNRRGTPA